MNTLSKRNHDKDRIIDTIIKYWIPKYEILISNYTNCKVRVILMNKCINITEFGAGVGINSGNMNVKFNKSFMSQEEILSNTNDRFNDNKCTFFFNTKICYLSIYIISPTRYNRYHNKISEWTNIVKNKQIDLYNYRSYNIMKKIESKCPYMNNSQFRM